MSNADMVRSRFMLFVTALFTLACLVAATYIAVGHPGDAKGDVKPLDTSFVEMMHVPIG